MSFSVNSLSFVRFFFFLTFRLLSVFLSGHLRVSFSFHFPPPLLISVFVLLCFCNFFHVNSFLRIAATNLLKQNFTENRHSFVQKALQRVWHGSFAQLCISPARPDKTSRKREAIDTLMNGDPFNKEGHPEKPLSSSQVHNKEKWDCFIQ